MRLQLPIVTTVMLLVITSSAGAITVGQVDDFEDGSTQSWQEGFNSPNPPVNVATGGPDGPNDNYLENTSSGSGSSGSKMTMFNNAQWTGDYVAAGVESVKMKLRNLGFNTLRIRIAFQGGGVATQYGSATAVVLSSGSGWQTATFDLSDLSLITGGATLDQVLSSVNQMRIVSAQAGPAWRGDVIDGVLGVDDIEAVGESVAVNDKTWSTVKALYARP